MLALLLACASQFDRYGGGAIDFAFIPEAAEGFVDTVPVPGAADVATLDEEPGDRDGFVSELADYGGDLPTRQIYAAGTEASQGSITSVETGGAYQIELYGDWLVGTELQDVGAAASVDFASLRLTSADGSDGYEYWGTWDREAVSVTVDGVTGTLSGPMAFLGEPATGEAGEPVTWTQDVTVVWAFDASIHSVGAGSGSGGSSPVPTF